MINHSNCNHPRTSSARAKCRRGLSQPWPAPPLYSLGPPPGATPKVVGTRTKAEKDNYGQTPRDRDKQCDVCGVEKIAWRGLDVISGIVLYVGQRCYYYVKHDPDGAVELD